MEGGVLAALDREHIRPAGLGAEACLAQAEELFHRLV